MAEALKRDGYSEHFIRSRARRQKASQFEEPRATVVMPYVKGVSEAIQRILRTVILLLEGDLLYCFCIYFYFQFLVVVAPESSCMDIEMGVVICVS